MKILLLFISVIFFCAASAQRIKDSSFDKFIKEYRISTSKSTLTMKMGKGLSIAFRSVGNSILLQLDGYGYIKTGVNTGDEAIFLLDDDSTIKANSKGLQFTKPYKYGEYFNFEYDITEEAVEALCTAKPVGLRLYYTNYTDIELDAKDAAKINEMAKVFLAEYRSKKSQF